MRLHQKSISKVSLLSVLKRRKSGLKSFLQETGIVTYELLKNRCDSMGVIPPEESEFLDAVGVTSADAPRNVSSPTEGLIVLDPPALVKENTGELLVEVDSSTVNTTSDSSLEEAQIQDNSSKKKKKKLDAT